MVQVDRRHVHNLTRPLDIVDLLKNVSDSQVTAMQSELGQQTRYFDYSTEPVSPPNAAQLPLEAACRSARPGSKSQICCSKLLQVASLRTTGTCLAC